MDRANFAVSALAAIAAIMAAWFARETFRRDMEQRMADEQRCWSLEFERAPALPAPEGGAWLSCAVKRSTSAQPVKIVRVERIGPRGVEIAAAQGARAARRPGAPGRAFTPTPSFEPHYSLPLFVKWPRASRFRSSARLAIRVTFAEVSASKRTTKIVLMSDAIPMTARMTASINESQSDIANPQV